MQEYTEGFSEDESLFSEDLNLLNWRGKPDQRNRKRGDTSECETENDGHICPLLLARRKPSRTAASKERQKGSREPALHRSTSSKNRIDIPRVTSAERHDWIDRPEPAPDTNFSQSPLVLKYGPPQNERISRGHTGRGRNTRRSDILSPKILQRTTRSNKLGQLGKKDNIVSENGSDASLSNDSNDESSRQDRPKSKNTPVNRKDHCGHNQQKVETGRSPNKHTIPPNSHNMPKHFPNYPEYGKIHPGGGEMHPDGSGFSSKWSPGNELDEELELKSISKAKIKVQGNKLKSCRSTSVQRQINYCTPEMCSSSKEEENELEVDLKCMGFNKHEVKWEELRAPEKRELHRIIHFRICHYINPDIIIGIGDHEFYCHRLVLQSYSEYFDEFNNLDSFTHIDISEMNVTKTAFIAIYSWMLSLGQGGFQHLKRENILEVLIACQCLKIKDYENQCLAFIDDKTVFSEDNAYFLFVQASRLKEKSIMELMIPRIQAFFLTLVSSKNFLELGPDDLCVILQSNYIVVHGEQEIFMSAIRWLMHDWKGRYEYMHTVMKCVRFGLMTPSQLIEIRKNPEIPEFKEITQDKEVQKLIEDGLAYAVEKGISGGTAEHKQRCELLGLTAPAPRNQTETSKSYRSYREFVEFLNEIKQNPRMMYSVPTTNSESIIEAILMSGSSNENINCSENENLVNFENREDIPSMTNILQSEKQEKTLKQNIDPAVAKKEVINSLKIAFSGKITPSIQNSMSVYNVRTHHNIPSSEPCPLKDQNNSIQLTQHKTAENLLATTKRQHPPKKDSKSFQYKKLSLRTSAAIIIQSAFRGHKVRKQVENIKKAIIDKEVKQVNDTTQDKQYSVTASENCKCECRNEGTSASSSSDNTLGAIKDPQETLYFPHRESILVFGGLDPSIILSKTNNASTVYRYHPEKNIWESVDSMPKARYDHCVSLLKGRIYLAGGSDPKKEELDEVCISNLMWSFDPTIIKWREEPRMITGRKNFGFLAFHGYLYAIGGQDKHDRILSSVERYDPNTREWHEVSSLSVARAGAAVCRFNHMIWAGGGVGNSAKETILNHVECYDPKRNIWTTNTPLRFPRAFAAFFTSNNSLYLVGGARKEKQCAVSTAAIDMWDEKKKEWKFKAELSIARHGHSICYLSNQMIIIGGTSTKFLCSLNSVEAWCVNRGTWIKGMSPLPVVLSGHSSVTLPMLTG